MLPSARLTPVVAPCPATLPCSATERLLRFVEQHPTPGCSVPALNWIREFAVAGLQTAISFRMTGPVWHQRTCLLPRLQTSPRAPKHVTFSCFFDAGFLDLGFKALESSRVAD
jgi:hypothetical protein